MLNLSRRQSLTSGLLLAMALVLGTLVLALPPASQPKAYGELASAGDFTLLSPQLTGDGSLYVIDSRSQKMLLYRTNAQGRITLISWGDLSRLTALPKGR